MKSKKIKLQLNKETIASLNTTQMSRINGGNGHDSGGYEYPDDLMFDGELVGGQIYNILLEDGQEVLTEQAFLGSLSTCHVSRFTCCTGAGCECRTATKPKKFME